jgi:branched-chain amino acid transport system substrate-binding protein
LIPADDSGPALAALRSATLASRFKIGLILPMTGPFASTGKLEAAARLYMAQNGDTVAGKKVEVIVKDDTSAPDVTKRRPQELVVNDKVNVLAGFGLTPWRWPPRRSPRRARPRWW